MNRLKYESVIPAVSLDCSIDVRNQPIFSVHTMPDSGQAGMTGLLKSLLLIILLIHLLPAQTDTVDVYILSGQSNMAGYGRTNELPDSLQPVIAGAYIWSNNQFDEFDPMAKGGFGPEVAFAARYRQLNSDREIYLVKQAVGGRSLHHGWTANTWLGVEYGPDRDNYYPGTDLDDPNMGNHYRQLSDMFLAAIGYLDNNDIPYVLQGFLWLQGEQDSKAEESAISYAQNLKNFSDRIHEDLGLTGVVPLVYGQVLPYEPAADRFTHRDELRQAQVDADRDSGHEDSFENAYMVSTDDVPLNNDNVHYTSLGLVQIGVAFAEEMQLAQDEMQVVSIIPIHTGIPEERSTRYDLLGRLIISNSFQISIDKWYINSNK